MNIIGMDLATTSGFAVMNGDRLVHAESFRPRDMTEHRDRDGNFIPRTDGEIFADFRSHLMRMLIKYDPKHAAIEQPLKTNITKTHAGPEDMLGHRYVENRPIGSMRTFLRLYGLRAIALELCAARNLPVFEVNQATWRSAFLGTSRTPKGESKAWLKQRAIEQCRLLRYDVTKPDAAEAVGIAFWLGGFLKLRKFEDGDLFAESAA